MPEINRQQMIDNLEEAVEAIRSARQALEEFPILTKTDFGGT